MTGANARKGGTEGKCSVASGHKKAGMGWVRESFEVCDESGNHAICIGWLQWYQIDYV